MLRRYAVISNHCVLCVTAILSTAMCHLALLFLILMHPSFERCREPRKDIHSSPMMFCFLHAFNLNLSGIKIFLELRMQELTQWDEMKLSLVRREVERMFK